MDPAQRNTLVEGLAWGASRLREARLPGELAAGLERLAGQVDQPCVLAVVGRMKAGKSTFINALLGEDVATVGVTETTATINRFRYGTPPDPGRPVRCYWRGGGYEDVGRDFADGLQGTDPEALRRAQGVDYLEYLLPNPFLRDVTLVDTPGTAAVVDEHQNRTAEFLDLRAQLRSRHTQETQRIGSEADAVIYLVGPVARSTDQAFLEEFGHVTGGRSRALNAVGVLAKIDLQPEVLARREELAARVAGQLRNDLNVVLPVSAGIHRAVTRLQEGGNKELIRLIVELRKIPPRRLEKLLDSDELYELDFEDCPVPPDLRRELRGDMPWTVFTTIARLAADPALTGRSVVEQLEDLAGFRPLRDVLERHFFKRACFLRCYNVLATARRLVNDVRFKHLPGLRTRDREDEARCERFVGFIRSANGDPAVARELEEFVSTQCGAAGRAGRVESALKDLDRKLAKLFHDMEEYNADFEALEQLATQAAAFSEAELTELRCLLGLYGVETEKRLAFGKATLAYASERQQAWSEARVLARDPARQRLAERAEARYGLILHELTADGPADGN
jgi:hypothetical protein